MRRSRPDPWTLGWAAVRPHAGVIALCGLLALTAPCALAGDAPPASAPAAARPLTTEQAADALLAAVKAPRVICSLWKVDDAATRALMTKFYELWNRKDGKPGLPTATALRKAQEFVASHERWKHPYFWAAWVLWGLAE